MHIGFPEILVLLGVLLLLLFLALVILAFHRLGWKWSLVAVLSLTVLLRAGGLSVPETVVTLGAGVIVVWLVMAVLRWFGLIPKE